MFKGRLKEIKSPAKQIDDYYSISPEAVKEIKKLAGSLRGLRITHINATAIGGGVAEMLRFLVPLQKSLGLDSKWYVVPPNNAFFQVTKEIHNFLQGKEGSLSEEKKKLYLDYNNYIAGLLTEIKTDVLIIHDPQPAAALTFLNGAKPKFCIWRCHIDTSHPNKSVWNFLLPFLRAYDRFVFTMPEFSSKDFSPHKIKIITPVIDPLAEKNIPLDRKEAAGIIKKFGIDTNKPLISQISRFDPWKDPLGVIDAYKLAKEVFPNLQLALVAQMASDDPEGQVIYKQVSEYVKGEKDIFLVVNAEDNEKTVNAFQVYSDIILQKSIKEGFGLTVTEAMWKGAVVVGGNVGGIKLQIKDGESGFLVNSSAQATEKIIYILKNPHIKDPISQKAKQSVEKNYLATTNLIAYLKIFNQMFIQGKPEDYFPRTPIPQFAGKEEL